MLCHARLSVIAVATGSNRAYVKFFVVQSLKQRQIIQFRVVRQGNNVGARVGTKLDDGIIRNFFDELHVINRPGAEMLFSLVAYPTYPVKRCDRKTGPAGSNSSFPGRTLIYLGTNAVPLKNVASWRHLPRARTNYVSIPRMPGIGH